MYEIMEKYHLKKFITPPLIAIIALLSSCCIHKNATSISNANLFCDKTNKDSTVSSTKADSILLALQDADSLALYSIASPQQQKDSIAYDSIKQYKIAKSYGKVKSTLTSIYNFLMAEDGILNSNYLLPKQAFYPDFVLRCYKDSTTTTLLFSFGSEELKVITPKSNSKTYQICQMKNVLRWFNLVIPDNDYIKNLLKWKQ